MNNYPVVSVLMPVHNSDRYLKDSVESVLNQSYGDFELIIINDGSSDGSEDIMVELAKSDSRISIIQQENKGIVEALNHGLCRAKGKYIARMDSDDISLPDRLFKQVAFMEEHPDVAVCGTWIRYFGDMAGEWQMPHDDEIIQTELLFRSVLAHPSVIIRKNILTENMISYRHGYDHAEDYDLWARIAEYAKLANIPEVLLLYRIHPKQIVQRCSYGKTSSANLIRERQVKLLGIEPSREEMDIYNRISTYHFECAIPFLRKTEVFLQKLLDLHPLQSRFSRIALRGIVQEMWFTMCYANSNLGLRVWLVFLESPVSNGIKLRWMQKIKFLVRCIIHRRRPQ